jgi:hypothetical protein
MNRRVKQGLAAAVLVGGLGVTGAGCLSRPVEHADPNLKTNFTSVVENKVIDKIDVLFDIDNSASMGDKQDYLKAAIPDLVNRFINPNCVDPTTGATTGASMNGQGCTGNSKPEFPPVHDMHLGIISSSLGPRGGNACNATATAPSPFQNVQAHNDDQAHLLNRTLTYTGSPGMYTAVQEGTVADAPGSDPFLYWYPTTNTMPAGPGTKVTSPTTLIQDFTDLVGGTGVFGCGIESQLESWYRFLVQPDPYSSINVGGGKASWSGVDTVILQQRHDFLRPDSLVAVIVLSDENDSEIDVRSLGQVGYNWMDGSFQPPRGTQACASQPNSGACQSCAQGSNGTTDANCKMGPYMALNDWGFDLNLRHVHMKQKYGVDPQFPIQRYVNGLTSPTVPDRCGEYGGSGCMQPASGGYVGQNDCQNPLFAARLPDGTKTDVNSLCHAPPGPRTKDLVFYAHIGGVPHELLHFDPTNLANSVLSDSDWTKILGKDPVHWDYTGIDPHMLEDFQPRSGIPGPGSANNADPTNGHDWITNTSNGMPGNSGTGAHILSVDREYACIFPLATPRDCTLSENANFCDCPHATGGVNAQELPPLCDQSTPTRQVAAKAYPTIRELLLAKLMGNQGIVSSLCPIHTTDMAGGTDPLYGYRPAVAVIVDRLKNALTAQCLPQTLQVDQATGSVPCLILLQLTQQAGMGSCTQPNCSMPGLQTPDPQVLNKFCAGLEADYQAQVNANGGSTTGLTDPATVPVCELTQLTPMANGNAFMGGSCANSTMDQGWCYVTGAAAGKCPQAIFFTPKALPSGALSNLQCIEQSVSVLGSGGTQGTPMNAGSSSGGGGGG